MRRFGGRLLAWVFAVGLVLALIGLWAATSESLRRQEHRFPFTKAVEPEQPLREPAPADPYHPPGLAAWPTP